MKESQLTLPLTREKAAALVSGEQVYLNGTIYAARDAAHKRMDALLREGKDLPFPLEDACLYYVGPTPPPPGRVIGAAGPTTSSRMDAYTPALLRHGLRGMIGKGKRSPEVIAALIEAGAVYFAAVGGAGALLSSHIKAVELIAFEDLGPEALRRLEVEDFPVTVVIDSRGKNLYEWGPEAWRVARRG